MIINSYNLEGFQQNKKIQNSKPGGTVCCVFLEGDGSFNEEKTIGKKKRGKEHKKCTERFDKIWCISTQKSVSGSSFGFLPPETRLLKLSASYLLSPLADIYKLGEALERKP